MMRRSFRFLSLSGNGVVGIRREDKNVYERRVPLTPTHVETLLKGNEVKEILVQPSTTRCFSDNEYRAVGAKVVEDLTPAGTICAVKEVPMELLLPDRSYMFFSHTIKAQEYNMPLLDTILKKNIRLLDYERIMGRDGRVVKFGPHAGFAGMIDTLHALGQALLLRGFATPFVHLSLSKEYRSLEMARGDLLVTGDIIRKAGLPPGVGPLVIGVTGAGSVSLAAQQMLHCLPCKYIEVEDLPRLWATEKKDNHHVYVVVIRSKDMVAHNDGKQFNTKDYYANPENYSAVFHERVAPYVHALVTGHYWEPRFPRLLTLEQIDDLRRAGRFPLLCLGDVTCDIGGSIEFFVKSTTIQNPLYVYDFDQKKAIDMQDFQGRGVVVLGVDHLPAEFPIEASSDFGDGLAPMIKSIAWSDDESALAKQEDTMGVSLFGSVITNKGKLTPNFEYIAAMRKVNDAKRAARKVLVVGGGMMAGPCVQHLLSDPRNHLTLVDGSRASLNKIVASLTGDNVPATAVCDASVVDATLSSLIAASDVVVSLLPAPMHPIIAASAIEAKVPMVTASYISPGMEQLRASAEDAGVVLVNEMGLDPGIDIMTSASIIDKIRADGGEVRKYVSFCGALPQPENSDVPLGYKFSWSPRGVLTAASRPTRFRVGGEWFDVEGKFLYHLVQPITNYRGLDLHWVPNGNSEKYAGVYGIPDSESEMVVRGTLRFSNYAPVVRAFQELQLLDETTSVEALKTGATGTAWANVIRERIGAAADADLEAALTQFLHGKLEQTRSELHAVPAYKALCASNALDSTAATPSPASLSEEIQTIVGAVKTLGLLNAEKAAPQTASGLILDSLCSTMVQELAYLPHERDFVMMIHRITAYFPATKETKTYVATLSQRGQTATDSATALTVGLPVGLTAQVVLDGGLTGKKGIVIPTDPAVYGPVLKNLHRLGVEMVESVITH